MFVLARLRESVRLTPQQMAHGLADALSASLSAKYCNRVIPRVGLVIAVRDVLEAGEPVVHAGRDGVAHVRVVFRAVVFRPIAGEVLEGVVRSASAEGVRVSLGFFDDVLVPPRLMRAGADGEEMRFEAAEQVWCWSYGGETLFMDVGWAVRVRVESEVFDETPPPRRMPGVMSPPGGSGVSAIPADVADVYAAPRPAPYRIFASVSEDGLGLTHWWRNC